MEHCGALTYHRCVTIVVHNYSCNWCNGSTGDLGPERERKR